MRILIAYPLLGLVLLLAACARGSETSIASATPDAEATTQATAVAMLPRETPTHTPTSEPTPTLPPEPEPTPALTPTPEPTPTFTPTPESTPTFTPTPEPTPTLTPTPEPTPEPTPTFTPTPEPTPTFTPTPEPTPTLTPTPEPTPEPTPTLTPTPTQEPVGHNRASPVPAGFSVTASDGLALTIVSATLDATSIVHDANRFNNPPSMGNRFTMVRVRVQNIGGSANSETDIGNFQFRLVGSSATLFSPFEHSCGVIPDELSLKLFKGGTGEGNVCFEIPEAESDLILLYEPLFSFDETNRRWLQAAEPDSVEPIQSVEVSLTPTPGQSPGHFRTRPMPPGETVTTSDGLALTIVSATLDATSMVHDANRFNDPPSMGNRFTMVRVRVQNIGGSANSETDIGNFQFRLVGSSATLFSPFEHSCGVIPDELSLKLFKGGTGEGNVCFEIPEAESDLILLYEPSFSFDETVRRWLRAAKPDSVEPIQSVEVSLEPGQSPGHFRTIPMPPGETVTTSDGLALTIVSVTLDATSIVLNANLVNDPPSMGNRFTMVRVRVQNIGGSANSETDIGDFQFRFVGSSATLFEHSCGVIPDELSLKLFKGGTGEGNVCFQIPEAESDLILLYDPLLSFDETVRRWLRAAEPDSVEPIQSVEVSFEPTPGQSPGHFRTNPMPPGETVTTSDGLGLTIVSATLDAASVVLDANRYNDPPSMGNRFTMVRVRVQNIGGSANSETDIEESDFRFVGSSATLFEHSCGVIPDELSLKLFKGGTGEGNVCFQIPEAESDLILLYEPSFSFDETIRRWLMVSSD